MSTLALAKAKWARKMANAGAKWKAGVTGKRSAYAEGLGRFAGVTAGSTMSSNYEAGVNATPAEEFQRAVAGKEETYARNFADAIAS